MKKRELIAKIFGQVFTLLLFGLIIPYWLIIPLFYNFIVGMGLSEIVSSAITAVIFTMAVLLISTIWALDEIIKKSAQKEEKELQSLQMQIAIKESELNKIKDKISNKEKELEAIKQTINEIHSDTNRNLTRLSESNTIGYPWLAEQYADVLYVEENKIAEYLKTKKRPAIKSAEQVRDLSKEKRQLLIKLKIAENQLRYYETVFPWLEDLRESDPIETFNAINEAQVGDEDEYERLKNYLSKEEYSKLSNAEKYQLALDRWKNRTNKSAWQIGIDYERYIGYVYEMRGYKVTYNGALEGLNDMGRDVIAENENEILVVQCKYWRKERTIHENHIFQLYGTVVLKRMESKKDVKGVFITSTTLSEVAKAVANELKLDVKENVEFDKEYPCIKCNINRTSGEKIYHLPFDQQYDKIVIEQQKGECYVSTTKEAESKGFRRAFKRVWRSDSV